jgi:hypothetical protein
VVGALAFRRGEPFDPQVYIRGADGDLYRPVKWEKGLLPCAIVGMAAVAIKRHVFSTLEAEGSHYPWFRNIYIDGQDPNLAEDWDFCLKCERVGIGVFADMGLIAPHMFMDAIDEKRWLSSSHGEEFDVESVARDPALDELKDSHIGETCIVIGNGPSLNDVPMEFFEKYPTFGANRIYKKLAPTYFASVNPLVLDQFGMDALRELHGKTKRFFLSDKWLIEKHNVSMQPFVTPLHSIGPGFSKDPARGIYEGHTVTFVNLQLAYWMGFSTVLLVGVDHRYESEGEPNQEVVMAGPDPNHFDPDYFPEGTHWHNADLEKSEEAYRMAKEAYDADGRKIINLGPDSALEVFERGDISEWA